MSGIRYGQKNQRGQSDVEQLIEVKQHLKNKWKISAHREPYLIFDKNGKLLSIQKFVKKNTNRSHIIKNPDILWFDKYGAWIIEMDGDAHLNLLSKDEERNNMFLNNGFKLIVVRLYLYEKGFDYIEYIDTEILERLK